MKGAVDYREMLKASLRGQIYDLDLPTAPSGNPYSGRVLNEAERRAYCAVLREVMAEEGFWYHPKMYAAKKREERNLFTAIMAGTSP